MTIIVYVDLYLGVDHCWGFSYVDPLDFPQVCSFILIPIHGLFQYLYKYYVQRLPQGLRRYFPCDGPATWVLVRHGYRAWPIEVIGRRFGNGWPTFRKLHGLKTEYKFVLAAERKWIFHAIILDQNDREMVFDWSAPNFQWRDLHPPPRKDKLIHLFNISASPLFVLSCFYYKCSFIQQYTNRTIGTKHTCMFLHMHI